MDDVIQPPSSAPLGVVQHVHVRVGRCDIAIPIEQVWQALPLPPQGLTALPRRSGGLLGVADVAGSAVPVVALERWVPLETRDDGAAALQRLLVLQQAGGLVGIRVDAVLGVKAVAAADIRRVHHAPDDNELFESVVPATASAPTLCILEVARLMRLGQAWCEQAQVEPAEAAATGAPAVPAPHQVGTTQRHAVFRIGVEQWAVPVSAVERVVPVPATELALGPKERTWAIGQWQGRKLPLVDISEGRQASDRQSAPWMVMLGQGPLLLGLTVSECQQFVDLPQAAVASIPGDPLLAGVALLPDGARLQVLDVAKLFGLTPEASISRRASAPLHAPGGAVQPDATEPLPYLVFDADQRYASPVDGIVGVVELPPPGQGRPSVGATGLSGVAWPDGSPRQPARDCQVGGTRRPAAGGSCPGARRHDGALGHRHPQPDRLAACPQRAAQRHAHGRHGRVRADQCQRRGGPRQPGGGRPRPDGVPAGLSPAT